VGAAFLVGALLADPFVSRRLSLSPAVPPAPATPRTELPSEERETLLAAIACERHRAVQLQVLNQLVMGVNRETDKGRLLDDVLRGAEQLIGATGASVYLMDEDSLRLEAFFSAPGLLQASEGTAAIAKPLVRRAMAERLVVRQEQALGRSAGVLGFLAAPLMAEGEVLGGLALCGRGAGVPFSPEDEVFMATLAAHVSVALQNMRRLDTEKQAALYLQKNMLPRIPRLPGLDYHVVYESATDDALVGGDFYDLMPLPDGRVAAVVGDVCGKGLAAASQTALTRYMLRAHAPFGLNAGEWLAAVNEGLQSNLDLRGFVTACLLILDPVRGSLELALAGHPAPLVVTPEEVVELRATPGLPLGAIPGQTYETARFDLMGGETIVLFSDGIYEGRRGEEMFGVTHLPEALRSVAGVPLLAGAARVLAQARAWVEGKFSDDLVLILIRPEAGEASEESGLGEEATRQAVLARAAGDEQIPVSV
jgi:serine phosphatase RsbU (regulator of sigma subunit)